MASTGMAITLRAMVPLLVLGSAFHDTVEELGTVTLLQTGLTHQWEKKEAAALPQVGLRRTRSIPAATVNLDLPPGQRWVRFYSDPVNKYKLARYCESERKPSAVLESYMQAAVNKPDDQEYLEELRGIIAAVNDSRVTMSNLLAINLAYENGVIGGCTGILAADASGSVIHGRNIDLPGLVLHWEALLFDATFQRGGKTLFTATTTAGYVGVHTGFRDGAFSVAQNKRSGFEVEKIPQFLRQGARPNSFVVRQALQEKASFKEAVHYLASQELAVPMYFHIAGVGPYEGAVITRDPTGYKAPWANVQLLEPLIDRWYLGQTNDDMNKPPKDTRRDTILDRFASMTQASVNMTSVQDIMLTLPVLNTMTAFTQVYQPSARKRRINLGMDELTMVYEDLLGVRIDPFRADPMES